MKGTIAKFLAFILVCSGFTAYLVVTIGNIRLFSNEYDLTATFDDVTGLLPNDNVKVAGVIVGKVSAVKVEQGRAKVTFSVREKVKVPTDSTAAIRWRNLLGQRYLYLYPGQSENALESGQAIAKTRPVVDLGELFNRLGPIVKAIDPQEVNTFLDTIVEALDGNEAKVSQALDDLAKVASTLGERDAAIGRLVTNLDTVAGTINARDREIRTILENLVAVSATFSQNTEVLDNAVTELTRFSDNFGGLLQDNRAHIDNLLANLATITELLKTKLPNVDTALGNLDEVGEALFRASRHGEWLNQIIYCGAIGRDASGEAIVETNCNSQTGVLPPVATSTGSQAVTELLGGGAQ